MFLPIRNEVRERFAAIEAFHSSLEVLTGTAAQTGRGLLFVQIYAAYEYVMSTTLQAVTDTICGFGLPINQIAQSLLPLFLTKELQSLQNCADKRFWEANIALVDRIFSDAPGVVEKGVTPNDGTHYRSSQIVFLFSMFGVEWDRTQWGGHLVRVNEVVDRRNAVAHGRETAEVVGRTFTSADMLHRIVQMKEVCLRVVAGLEKSCSSRRKIKRKKAKSSP